MMEFKLTITGHDGDIKDMMKVMQELADQPRIKSAIEVKDAQDKLDIIEDEEHVKAITVTPETKENIAKTEEKASKKQYELSEVRAASAEFIKAKGGAVFKDILKQMGAKSVSDLAPEKYGSLMEAINAD